MAHHPTPHLCSKVGFTIIRFSRPVIQDSRWSSRSYLADSLDRRSEADGTPFPTTWFMLRILGSTLPPLRGGMGPSKLDSVDAINMSKSCWASSLTATSARNAPSQSAQEARHVSSRPKPFVTKDDNADARNGNDLGRETTDSPA